MLKVIEVSGESERSWEDTATQVVVQASKSVENVKSIFIKHQEATGKDGRVAKYRINARASFALDKPLEIFQLDGL